MTIRCLANRGARWVAALTISLSIAGGIHAKPVTSPDELAAVDYWSYIQSTVGSFGPVSVRGATPDILDFQDPVVAGKTIDGQLVAGTSNGPEGPGAAVNAVLNYAGLEPMNASLDLGSFVFLDIAAFSSTVDEAVVRIKGSGIGGDESSSGEFGSASANAIGGITLYETDTTGATGSILRFWETRANFETNEIDDTFVIETNRLYRVIVRSTASINISNFSAFEIFAYMFIDPVFTSETAGAEVFVSPGAEPVVPGPEVGISVEKAVISADDSTQTVSVSARTTEEVDADVHFVLISPDNVIYEWPDWNTVLRPALRLKFPAGFDFPSTAAFNAAGFPGGLAPGSWTAAVGLAEPGTYNWIDIALTRFEVVE